MSAVHAPPCGACRDVDRTRTCVRWQRLQLQAIESPSEMPVV